MANYEQLKQAVTDVIKQNGNNEITGDILQSILLSITSVLGQHRNFADVVGTSFNPGVEDGNVFYIANQSGVYPNFNGITVDLNQGVNIFINTTSGWVKKIIPVSIDTTNLATKSEILEKVNSSDIGMILYKTGNNIVSAFTEIPNSDTGNPIWDVGFFYDKRDGRKLAGGEFSCSKNLLYIKGGVTYNYWFRLYGYAGVCFFDENDNFVFSIASPTNDGTWVVLEGEITLPENVTKVGYSFSYGIAQGRNNAKFIPNEDIIVVSDKVFQPAGQSVLKENVTNDVDPNGDRDKIINEEALISYSPNFDFLGISFIEGGQNIVDKYRNAPITDSELFSDGMFYDKRNGSKLTGLDFICSKTLQPIKGGVTYDYWFRLYRYAGVCFFDENGDFVMSIGPSSDIDSTWEILQGTVTLPDNVALVGYTFSRAAANGRNNALFSPQSDILLVEDKIFMPAGTIPEPPDLSGYYKKNTGTIVSLGDSVTEFGTYPQQLGALLGYNGLRCGVGGTRLSTHVLQHYDQLSFYQIAEAIGTGNFTNVNIALDAIIAAAQTPDPWKSARLTQTKNNLNNTDFNNVDIITVAFGTNDFTGAKPIGDISLSNEDVNTLVGALNYGCRMILEAYPQIKIVVSTPTHRMNGTSPGWVSSDEYKNSSNLGLLDYCNALIEASNMRHIPCKDMYREGWFCVENHVTYFSDAVHPRALGYTQIAKILAGFIKSKLF